MKGAPLQTLQTLDYEAELSYYQSEVDKIAKEMHPQGMAYSNAQRRKAQEARRQHLNKSTIWFVMNDEDGGAAEPVIDFTENAGIDLFAAADVTFSPAEAGGFYIADVPTTFMIVFPPGVHGLVAGRSGNAIRRGTVPFYGVIDNSYREPATVRLYTHDTEVAKNGIQAGTAIAQLLPINLAGINLLRCRVRRTTREDLTETNRGSDGFGSSGNNI